MHRTLRGCIIISLFAIPLFAVGGCLAITDVIFGGRPNITTSFGQYVDTQHGSGKHAGIDFGGARGTPILAAAPGIVYWTKKINKPGCGRGIGILHMEHARFTIYCHLSKILVENEDGVKRGQEIGLMGDAGNQYYVHLHFEVNVDGIGHNVHTFYGNYFPPIGSGIEDPMKYIVGCYDRGRIYPNDRLVLTYPFVCKDS